ncbi:MAG: glycogen/starch synthase [Gemmatimonadota bacterium]
MKAQGSEVAKRRRISETRPRQAGPSQKTRIVHLSAEYWPYIRTGGLGEAVRGMATFQSYAGSQTTVLLPLYTSIRDGDYGLKAVGKSFTVPIGTRVEVGRLWEAAKGTDGPRVLFLENAGFFYREGVYGQGGEDYPDNHLRFSFLAAAAAQILPEIAPGPAPVLLHMHDWHTALAVVYLRNIGKGNPFADQVATVLSVHNGGFQGHFPREVLPEMGLPFDLYHMDIMEWYGRANILKAGLVFTDMATTVSPSHSFELRTEDGGFGLHHTFLGLHERLVGVLNGIDYRIWDPETDPYIQTNYSAQDLSGKSECKAALQKEYALEEDPDKLVIGMVARMVAQKGMDLILGGRAVREADAQFIFLGSGERRFEEGLKNLAAAHPDRVVVQLDFTEEREHRLVAGADALLMPSLYEPCGLTQMRSMRYGTPPLARRVGGLDDTIQDGRTGLLFDDYKPQRLDWLIERAIARYHKPATWRDMVAHGMEEDFSWESVVARYFEVYEQAFETRAESLNAQNI